MKTSIYGKMQMNISTNKILQSSLKIMPPQLYVQIPIAFSCEAPDEFAALIKC